jgi:hypothetical protein
MFHVARGGIVRPIGQQRRWGEVRHAKTAQKEKNRRRAFHWTRLLPGRHHLNMKRQLDFLFFVRPIGVTDYFPLPNLFPCING